MRNYVLFFLSVLSIGSLYADRVARGLFGGAAGRAYTGRIGRRRKSCSYWRGGCAGLA